MGYRNSRPMMNPHLAPPEPAPPLLSLPFPPSLSSLFSVLPLLGGVTSKANIVERYYRQVNMIKGGSSYVFFPQAFSNDGKRLLVCTGKTVSIFSTSTGLQVIPSVLCQPEESNTKPPKMFAYISVEGTREEKNQRKVLGQIRKCNLTKSRLSCGVILKETERPEFLTISPSGKLFGIRNKQKLLIWKLHAENSESVVTKKITLHHTKIITVLAFHPTERIVAAGDVTGRILIWRGFGLENFPTTGP